MIQQRFQEKPKVQKFGKHNSFTDIDKKFLSDNWEDMDALLDYFETDKKTYIYSLRYRYKNELGKPGKQ